MSASPAGGWRPDAVEHWYNPSPRSAPRVPPDVRAHKSAVRTRIKVPSQFRLSRDIAATNIWLQQDFVEPVRNHVRAISLSAITRLLVVGRFSLHQPFRRAAPADRSTAASDGHLPGRGRFADAIRSYRRPTASNVANAPDDRLISTIENGPVSRRDLQRRLTSPTFPALSCASVARSV